MGERTLKRDAMDPENVSKGIDDGLNLRVDESVTILPSKKLCVQDENGKMFFVKIEKGPSGRLIGFDLGVDDAVDGSASSSDGERDKRRRRKKSKLDDAEVEEEAMESVEGYDPLSGQVLGPEGQPVGPGNGSVVIRDIHSEKEINQAWFTTKEDKSALTDKGLNWKQGTWSSQEIALLNANIFEYCRHRGIEDPVEIIFDMPKDERKDFYRCVSRGLQRPLFSVYRRVIRMYDAKNHIGRYTDDEVEKLRALREELGSDWAKIGAAMGRSAASVKDRCRLLKDECKSGKWEEDEEERLINAVHEVTGKRRGTSVTCNVPWSQVAAAVRTRSEKQCRAKWLNYLNWKQAGGDREWSRGDEVQLISKIARLGDVEESAIDWISLADGWTVVRSPQWLRNKWRSMKRTLSPLFAKTLSVSETCKLYLEDLSRCSATGSRLLNRNSSSADGRGAGAARPTSSLQGNDFWGVGEDSNGAASTADVINGISQEATTLDRLDLTTNSTLIRPSTFSIHTDLPSQLLIDGSALQLPAAGGVVPGGGETLHFSSVNASDAFQLSASTSGIAVSGVSGIASSSPAVVDASLPPTTAFPVFANVCVDQILDDVVEGSSRSGLTSPSRDSTHSRDFIVAADRDSRSPFPHYSGPTDGGTDSVTGADGNTFMLTSSGQLIPFSAATTTTDSPEPLNNPSGAKTRRRRDISEKLRHRQFVSHQVIIGDRLTDDGLLADVAIQEDEGAQYEVECVEDEDFIQVGAPTFISDSDFFVIDAGVTVANEGNDDDDDDDHHHLHVTESVTT